MQSQTELLPDQYGVLEPPETYNFPSMTKQEQELHWEYVGSAHIETGDLTKILNLFKTNPPTHPTTVWFIRNFLMDCLKIYYRVQFPNHPFDLVESSWQARGPQAYYFIKDKDFLDLLEKVGKTINPRLEISKDMWEKIERTYKLAEELKNKQKNKSK